MYGTVPYYFSTLLASDHLASYQKYELLINIIFE